MGWIGVGLALLLPWLAGALALRRLWLDGKAGAWALYIGYGYWLGLPGAALGLMALSGFGLRPAFWLILLSCLAITGWAGRDLGWPKGFVAGELGAGRPVLHALRLRRIGWQGGLILALSLWLGWRLAILALHVWYQPLFPWDAWTTWALRARVWSELGQLVPFVAPERWATEQSDRLYTLEAWRYPPLVSLIALWPTLPLQRWDETAANLPWLGAGLSLGLGLYAQLRRWGADRLTSLFGVWLLMSLPLLETHIALAGYADLWLAGALGLSLIAFLHWVRSGERQQLALCLILAAAWPLIKLEGTVWLSLLVLGLIVARPRWGRLGLALAGAMALGLLALWFIGIRLATPWGMLELSTQAIAFPFIGHFALGYHPNWWALGLMLFGLENWHLLGYLLIAGIMLAGHRLIRGGEPWLRAAFVLVSGSLGLLWVLFFLTDAAAWLEQGTASGRLLLQFAVLYVFFLLVLWLDIQGVGSPAAKSSR